MDFFTGQILPLAISYAPKQTAMCNGQTLPVNQNQALFTLLGIAFGGNGQPGGTFGLPNTSGRTIVGGIGAGTAMGTVLGEANHTLLLNEIPSHTHTLGAITGGSQTASATGNMPGTSNGATYAAPSNPAIGLAADPLALAGGGQPHNNMQPSMPINFAIVLYGIFPTRA